MVCSPFRTIFALMMVTCSLGACSPASQLKEQPEEIRIARSGDGHFYTDASVNGKDVRFMIDTGASEVVLTPDDARAAGVPLEPDQNRALGDGASGIVIGQTALVKSLTLGTFNKADAEVAVVPGATVSLLGQSFLSQIDEIVIRRDEMLLRSR